MRRRGGPGLANLGIEAKVADELARVLAMLDVTDRGQERRGDDHVHAGHAHQPLNLHRAERGFGDQPLGSGDL
jgi:hypothetical protein